MLSIELTVSTDGPLGYSYTKVCKYAWANIFLRASTIDIPVQFCIMSQVSAIFFTTYSIYIWTISLLISFFTVADPGYLNRIRIIEFKYFYPKNHDTKFSKLWSRSFIPDPGSGFFFHPGSGSPLQQCHVLTSYVTLKVCKQVCKWKVKHRSFRYAEGTVYEYLQMTTLFCLESPPPHQLTLL